MCGWGSDLRLLDFSELVVFIVVSVGSSGPSVGSSSSSASGGGVPLPLRPVPIAGAGVIPVVDEFAAIHLILGRLRMSIGQQGAVRSAVRVVTAATTAT